MKRTIFLIVMIGTSLVARARYSSMFELSLGGGWSAMNYPFNTTSQPLLDAQSKGSYGWNAHVGYGFFFNKYVGVGIGIDLARYGATAVLNGDAQWLGVCDTDGERYDHRTKVSNWQDQQELYMLEVPLCVCVCAPITNKTWFSGAAGIKVGSILKSRASYSGDLKHTAGYAPWQLELEDMKEYGFYSSQMSGSYSLSPQLGSAAFVKAGIETALDRNKYVYFFTHAYCSYYFTSAIVCADTPKDLGFKNDTPNAAMQEAHSFMSDYTSIFDTKLTNGKAHPMGVGLEVGLRLRTPHKKAYSCHCQNK